MATATDNEPTRAQETQDRGIEASDSLEQALMNFADETYREFSRYRFAEEREWYELALFYQRRQWLKWNNGRWTLMKQNPNQPKPMPVTNYFAKTVNTMANQLNGAPVKITVSPNDDDDSNQGAADYALSAINAIDEETGVDVLRPLLAKHDALWGLAVIKDMWDSGLSNGRTRVPQITVETTRMLSCPECGGTHDIGPAPSKESDEEDAEEASDALPAENAEDRQQERQGGQPVESPDQEETPPCPQCGATDGRVYEKRVPTVTEVAYFNKGKITSEVRPIFEIYLPRDCQNANLAKRVIQRYRLPLGELRRLYGDKADDVQVDQPIDVHEIYLEALRSLVNYNYLHDHANQTATVTEMWTQWDEMPKKLQDKLQAEIDDPDQLEILQQDGLYTVHTGGTMLEWGENFMEGESPFTFFLWEVDPANVYPKSGGTDLVPLQKRLNRNDSLIELGMMCNAAGKWLWPTTQTKKAPSGSPNEVAEYDPQGDGKIKPEFIQPEPFSAQVWQHRQSIIGDFQQLGNTMGVAQGQMPAGGAKAFRALAYLGAKADEQTAPQRDLWEKAWLKHYKKCLLLARRFWDEPRKVKVAGFNGRYSMKAFMGKDLQGDYSLEFEKGSSRPRTVEEKTQAFASLLEAGMVNPQDSGVRDYVVDMANLDEVNLTDHLQYRKAQRDLDRLKTGQMPAANPFNKPDIFFKVFSDYTLTEEFEALAPPIQQALVAAAAQFQQQMAAAMAPPPGTQAQALGAALKNGAQPAGNNPLNGEPGATVAPAAAEAAAVGEGANIARQLA